MKISDHIPEYSDYKNAEKFEKKLHEIKRWHGDVSLKPEESESVFEHTISGLNVIDSIFKNSPNLSKEINVEDLKRMFLVHDTAEMFVGDAPQEMNKEDRVIHDAREKFYGILFLNDSEFWVNLFKRCMDVKDNDKEALMCKYVDKVQAGLFLVEEIACKYNTLKVLQNIHIYSLPCEKKYFDKISSLISIEAKEELKQFSSGYKRKVNHTKHHLLYNLMHKKDVIE